MRPILGRLNEEIYALMRFVVGGLFACHGAQKLFGAFGKEAVPPSNHLIFAAGVIEFVGGIAIAVGLLTTVMAFLASGTMAVAYFKQHAPDGFWPIVNKGELAVLYCFIFLYICARGSGRYSLDSLLFRGRTHAKRPGS